jgi:hypothetical protein
VVGLQLQDPTLTQLAIGQGALQLLLLLDEAAGLLTDLFESVGRRVGNGGGRRGLETKSQEWL